MTLELGGGRGSRRRVTPFLGPLMMGLDKGVTNPVQSLKKRGTHTNRYLLCRGNYARNLILFYPLRSQ